MRTAPSSQSDCPSNVMIVLTTTATMTVATSNGENTSVNGAERAFVGLREVWS